jgi:hypothetical protein
MRTAATKRSDNHRWGRAPAKATPSVGHEPVSASPTVHSDVAKSFHSWKEIAVYLHREVRTVQRWEKREGMPVHRHQHPKGSSIFAFKHEVDEWQSSRSQCRALGPARTPNSGAAPIVHRPAEPDPMILRSLMEAVLALLISQVAAFVATSRPPDTAIGSANTEFHSNENWAQNERVKLNGTSIESGAFLSRMQ